jgi:hypothetical protein
MSFFGTSNAGYNAATTAGNVGAGYGSGAAGVNSTLLPFLTRELTSPQGFTQQQQGSMLDSAEGGTGGSTAGLTTEANLATARNRNSGGFSGALDDAARQKDKALAGTSEGIAAKSADLQQENQQRAATGLGDIQSLDTNAQLKAMGLVPEDLNAQSSLNKTSGWASQLKDVLGDATDVAGLASGFKIPGFTNFKPV